MTDRRETALKSLAARIAADGRVSEDEALMLRMQVFPDGIVTRSEAETLVRLNAVVSGEGDAWRATFVEALTDHVLYAGEPIGILDESAAQWLEGVLVSDAPLRRDLEVELLVRVLERAESTPAGFQAFVRDRLFQLLTAPPPADLRETDVAIIRRVVFAVASDESIHVSRDEAEWLFAIDAATDGGNHHASWRDLFVKSICNCLLAADAPALLARNSHLHRAAILGRAPASDAFSRIGRAFSGGPEAIAARLRQPGPAQGIAAYYEARAAEAAAAERLTLAEVAWVVARARADARVTANEQAVLDALRGIEREQAAAAGR